MLRKILVVLGCACVATCVAAPSGRAASAPAGYVWGSQGSVNPKGVDGPQYDSPTAVTGIPDPVVQVVATNSDDYALTDTGDVYAWGAAQDGEIGDGPPTSDVYVTTPTRVQFPAGVRITSLPNPMPYATAMAIDSSGHVWGWGYDSLLQLCTTQTDIDTPIELPFSGVRLASGAGDHALYDVGGTLYACGANGFGDLGAGTKAQNTSPAPVAVVGLPARGITSVQTANRNSGILFSDGSYYDWGFNPQGQVGDGSTKVRAKPKLVKLPAPVTQVSQGGSGSSGTAANGQTIAILSDGSVMTWGANLSGQLGDGTMINRPRPVAVQVPRGVTFTTVASGGADEYAIDSTGDTWSWGSDVNGQLGNGKAGAKPQPLPMSIGLQLSQISATASDVYGLR